MLGIGSQYAPSYGYQSNSSKTTNTVQGKTESITDELERRLEGVECEDERNDIIIEVFGGVCLGRFDPSKVDDVLTPETRYQFTQEDKDYFANKYDLNNMTPYEMDEMLYEMELMGAITQSERLSVNPFINTDGSLRAYSSVTVVDGTSSVFGENSLGFNNFYGGSPIDYWEERMRELQTELITGGANVDKDAHREELEGTQLISQLLGSIFNRSSSSYSNSTDIATESENLQQWLEHDQMMRNLLSSVQV